MDNEHFVGLSIYSLFSRVLLIHSGDRALEFIGACFGERNFHHVLEFSQSVPIGGILVVLCDSAVPLLVDVDDFGIGVLQQRGFVNRFVAT